MIKYIYRKKKGGNKMKLSEVRREAREALTGKWTKGVCIVLAYLLVSFAIGFVIGLFDEDSLLGVLVAIAQLIISVPLSFGISLAFLKLKRNEDIKAFGFIDIAVDNFSRAWKITGRTFLKMIIPVIVLVVAIFVYAGILVYSTAQLSVGEASAAGMGMIVALVVYIAAIIYLLAVSLLYSLTTYIAYDNKEKTALEVVNESARLMKGNRWKIILLELSFIGWAILTVFTLGIGYLWLLPYMQVAMVCFYDRLAQPKVNEEETPAQESPIQEA